MDLISFTPRCCILQPVKVEVNRSALATNEDKIYKFLDRRHFAWCLLDKREPD
jgi:hypothetical protein